MQVIRFEESAHGVFAWNVEHTFLELHKHMVSAWPP
jgi:hypothetical protein